MVMLFLTAGFHLWQICVQNVGSASTVLQQKFNAITLSTAAVG